MLSIWGKKAFRIAPAIRERPDKCWTNEWRRATSEATTITEITQQNVPFSVLNHFPWAESRHPSTWLTSRFITDFNLQNKVLNSVSWLLIQGHVVKQLEFQIWRKTKRRASITSRASVENVSQRFLREEEKVPLWNSESTLKMKGTWDCSDNLKQSQNQM